MTNPTIDARLVGSDKDAGHVQYADFLRFFSVMSTCLKRAEAAVTSQNARIHYRIVGLRDGSAALCLEAIHPRTGEDNRAAAVNLFKKTIAAIQTGDTVDARLSAEALEDFRELYKAPKKTKEIWIDGTQITSRYLANIDDILKSAFASEGSVTGVLKRLNVHNKNEFVLYPPIGDAVKCIFPDKMFEQVRAAVKCNVTVLGTLTYPPDRPYPTKVQVKELEVHPPDDELATLRELRGLFRGCFDGKTPSEFIRDIRDESD